MRAQLAVPDKLKWLGARGNAAFYQPFHFLEPAGGEHGVHTAFDALIERGTRRGQPDFDGMVALEQRAARAMQFGDGLAGKQADFERTNHFGDVARSDARSGGGVEPGEDAVQMRMAARVRHAAQAFAQLIGASGCVGKPFEQRAQIQAGAHGKDRQLFTAAQIFQDAKRAAAVVAGREHFIGIKQVHQVMRNSLLFGGRHFGCADVKAPVNLRGIAAHHFPAEAPGHGDAQRGFARAGGADDGHQRNSKRYRGSHPR